MLEIKNLSFAVDTDNGNKKIIDDVSFTVERDSYVVITGPNGSGKSTLLKLIMGIEKPTAGRIIFDGEDVTGLSITERAEMGMGFAFQQPVRFKGITAKNLIDIAAKKKLSVAEACRYLSAVGLCAADYIRRELDSSLSGGELKRIEIASVIARESKLSLFDEPEAGIDLWSFNSLINVFENMKKRTKGAVIIISHQERILDIADTVIVIEEGKISKMGSKKEILPGIYSQLESCCLLKTAAGD
ncbi:MAG: ATP-binding cassette domain-containing protein [Ruminococcaceae bacterium]|nr:ATP-binding cassette domain-containing protein [Oscillospiraceae bacterium]